MIDLVSIFESVAVASGMKFIYGGSQYANYELGKLKDLKDGTEIVFMLPFTENGSPENGAIDEVSVSTTISIGRKFDTATPTKSSLDETERQKYDRRLSDLKQKWYQYVSSIGCSSILELTNLRFEFFLNRHATNVDGVSGTITFTYGVGDNGTGYEIQPVPPVYDQALNTTDCVKFKAVETKEIRLTETDFSTYVPPTKPVLESFIYDYAGTIIGRIFAWNGTNSIPMVFGNATGLKSLIVRPDGRVTIAFESLSDPVPGGVAFYVQGGIGSNGFFDENGDSILNGYVKEKPNGSINLSNLPTSPAGLEVGDLWRDGSDPKIV